MKFNFEIQTDDLEEVQVDAEVTEHGVFTWETGYGAESGFIEILEEPTFSFSVNSFEDDPFLLTSEDIGSMQGVAQAIYWDRIDV